MGIFENLVELKQLADTIYEEGIKKFPPEEPMANVAEKVREWISNESLVLRSAYGGRTEIANKIKQGELFPTSYPAIMATDEAVRDAFELYVTNGRVMDSNKVLVRKGYHSIYYVDKAVNKGEIIRISDFGSTITLYVE